jgi:hypothetical protein
VSEVRLAVLGAGSVRCGPSVFSTLATFFGERPLEIRLYDSDPERLDLFDRFARLCFLVTKAPHSLLATEDPKEALADADRAILQVGDNCARKYLKATRRQGVASLTNAAMVEQALDQMLEGVPAEVDVVSLQTGDVYVPLERYAALDWPSSPSEVERGAVPHQVLRWIHGEEYLHELLAEHERSPLKAWLNDPSSAPAVVRQ